MLPACAQAQIGNQVGRKREENHVDLLTQGLLGATLAQAGAKTHETRIAIGVGFAAGLLADADALIRSASDPLLTIEYHRHFTHSVFFIPIGALIAALILWPLTRKKLTFSRLYRFCFLGYSLSGMLDAFTSYGTHLFWPLTDTRTTWHMISIVDPLFTLVLLLAVLYGFRNRAAAAARVGLIAAAAYLSVAGAQLYRAESAVAELAQTRGHVIEKGMVKPTLGNILLWRSIYLHGGIAYVDVIRAGLSRDPKVFEGGAIRLLDLEHDLPGLRVDSTLYRDIKRFELFSDGFVALHPENPRIVGDVRYANNPAGLKPLWGIEFDLAQPDEHVAYRFYRDLSGENRRRFLDMLLARGATH